jgi:hypothetical protein
MRTLKYLKYLYKHKLYVFQECVKLGIPFRGIIHDWSKFLPSEFIPYKNYFYTEDNSKYNESFDKAWLLHQNRNNHHWQYHVLINDSGVIEALDMPLKLRKEMLADWRGAGRAITGKDDTRDWYLSNKHNMILHVNTRRWVEDQLNLSN